MSSEREGPPKIEGKVKDEQSQPSPGIRKDRRGYAWIVAILLQAVCAMIMKHYNPSNSRPTVSQEFLTKVCIAGTQRPCRLHVYIPRLLIEPPPIVFANTVVGFGTLVLLCHGLRAKDKYQDRMWTLGMTCGFLVCGAWAIREGQVSSFKDYMPGIITATMVASAGFHTLFGALK